MALGGKNVAVVVPAHNEERLIGKVVGGMPPFVDRVVVVDDGSTDATAERASSSGGGRVLVIRHGSKRGVGAAIRTGYRTALEAGADVAAVMPGDAQADPADLHRLLAPVIEGRCDYSKGNRMADPGAMPRIRRVGNRILSLLTRRALGHGGIRDAQCGYTAAGRDALGELVRLPFCDGYGYPNEILCSLLLSRRVVLEVPVRAVYADETSGIWIPSYAVKMAFILARCAMRTMRDRIRAPRMTAVPGTAAKAGGR